MSRKPGIGKTWIEKYKTDVYPRDEVILNYKKMRPPKFYDSHYELTEPKEHAKLKNNRAKKAKKRAADNTPERLKTKEKILELNARRYKRESNERRTNRTSNKLLGISRRLADPLRNLHH